MSIIKLKNVSKFYQNKGNISTGFTRLNVEFDIGEFVVITGESGSGKSTLLNVISGLDSYEEGEMYINGLETSHYTEVDYEGYRRKYIGNIFQHFNLVNSYTVYQNVELVLLLNGYKKKEVKDKVLDILETVGLSKYKNTKASKLSGGQKQRVAIARALAKDTPIIVADEPTGNLDQRSAKSVMKLLKDISKDKLVVIVTHNYDQVEEYATRKISMHDGKITEDKSLQATKVEKPELVQYKDLTNANKVVLGFRNAFNIKAKFVLLFLVYFFLTILVFSEYSSLNKMSFEESLEGYNEFFKDTDPARIILNKKDKSIISLEDVSKLSNLENIDRVVHNDLTLDLEINLSNNEGIYIYGNAVPLSKIDRVDDGVIDEKSVVIEGPSDSYNFLMYKDELLKGNFSLYDDEGNTFPSTKISGLRYTGPSDSFDYSYTIYVPDEIFTGLYISTVNNKSKIDLSFDGNTFKKENYDLYFDIKPLEGVEVGHAYAFNEMNYRCNSFDCTNKNLNIKISNIYYEDSIDLKIDRTITKDNYKKYIGSYNYDDVSNVVFVNPADYEKLFDKGYFQSSVFVSDIRSLDETIKELDEMGYNTYSMKDNLVDTMKDMRGIIRIFRTVVFLIATVALFFISYFIIKIILKSRNVYYSTIRILGATKKIARQLLNIELFIDINIAYLVYLMMILIVKTGIIKWNYISNLITYFTFKDYVIIYLILALMSLLISNRYSHKLFKDSVMSTYREEV